MAHIYYHAGGQRLIFAPILHRTSIYIDINDIYNGNICSVAALIEKGEKTSINIYPKPLIYLYTEEVKRVAATSENNNTNCDSTVLGKNWQSLEFAKTSLCHTCIKKNKTVL